MHFQVFITFRSIIFINALFNLEFFSTVAKREIIIRKFSSVHKILCVFWCIVKAKWQQQTQQLENAVFVVVFVNGISRLLIYQVKFTLLLFVMFYDKMAVYISFIVCGLLVPITFVAVFIVVVLSRLRHLLVLCSKFGLNFPDVIYGQ